MEKTKKQLSLKLKGSKRPQKIMLDLLEPVDREELVAMLSKDPPVTLIQTRKEN